MSTKLDNAFHAAAASAKGKDGRAAAGEPAAADVAAFLTRHPDFLNERPELLEALTPPAERSSGRRVLDMQRYMIARLQGSLRDIRAREADLLASARANRTSTTRTHAAVLALCEAGALDSLMEIISNDLPTLLEVDVVVIGVEAEPEMKGSLRSTAGVCLLPAESVQTLLGSRDVLLTDDLGEEAQLFGGAASLVNSAAFLRLRLGPPGRPALLALGSRDAQRFAPGQATDMLAFLAEGLGRRMREWLHYAL